MFEVTAVANGYYGNKVRVPGERFGIDKPEDFSHRWMDTDDSKVLAQVKKQAKETGKIERGMSEAEKAEENAKIERSLAASEWLKRKGAVSGTATDDDGPETRRVNTGGTDGVVGAEIPKPGQKLSAKERIAMAEAASGRTGLKAAEADDILAALSASGGSDNDDRSRDVAIDQTQTAPLPDAGAGTDI